MDDDDEEEEEVESKKKKKRNNNVGSSVNLLDTEWILACPVQISEKRNKNYCRCKILALQVGSRNVVHIASIIFIGTNKPPKRVKNLFSPVENIQFVEYLWPQLFIDTGVLQSVVPGLDKKLVLNSRLALSKRSVYITDVFSDVSNNFQMWYIMLACLDISPTINITFSLANTLVKCWSEIDQIPSSSLIQHQQTNHFDVIKYFLDCPVVSRDLGVLVRTNKKIIDNLNWNWIMINNASKDNGTQSDGDFESDWFLDKLNVSFLELNNIFLDSKTFVDQSEEYYRKIWKKQYHKLETSVKIIDTPEELKYKQVQDNVPDNYLGFVELPCGKESEKCKVDMEFRYDLMTGKPLPYINPLLRKPANDKSKHSNKICIMFNVYHFDLPFLTCKMLQDVYKKFVESTTVGDYEKVYEVSNSIGEKLVSIILGNKVIKKKLPNGKIVTYKSPTYKFHEIISTNRPIYAICIDLDIKNTNIINDMINVDPKERFDKRVQLFEIVKTAVTFVCSECMKLPVENFEYCLYETIVPDGNNSNKLGFHFVFRYRRYCFLNTEIVRKILVAINVYLVKKHSIFFGSYNFVDMEIYKVKFHTMRLGLNFKPSVSDGVLLPIFSNTVMSMLPSFSLSHVSRDVSPDDEMIIDVCDINHETKEIYKMISSSSSSRQATPSSNSNVDYTDCIRKLLPTIFQSILIRTSNREPNSLNELSTTTKEWKIVKKTSERYRIIPNINTCINPDHYKNALSNSFASYIATILTSTEVEVICYCRNVECGNRVLDVYNVENL